MGQMHIGREIKRVLDDSDLSVTEFARKINKSRGNVYSILTRSSIDTELLEVISAVLNYDFFLLFSHTFEQMNKRVADLEKENNMVRTLNELLLEKYGKLRICLRPMGLPPNNKQEIVKILIRLLVIV
jgi:transcriptional regulator with XRE-family HTH domain